MKNVEAVRKGDKLIIEVDLTKEFGDSNTGKTIIVASSEGGQKVDGTDGAVSYSLNVYRKKG